MIQDHDIRLSLVYLFAMAPNSDRCAAVLLHWGSERNRPSAARKIGDALPTKT
jgi:hypothetical protein